MRCHLIHTSAMILAILAMSAAELRAHGASYRGPPIYVPPPTHVPSPGPGTMPPPPTPGGLPRGTTSGPDLRRWEAWWGLNKEEFFPTRGLTLAAQTPDGDYDTEGGKPALPDVIRSKLVPLLIGLLKPEYDVQIRDSAVIALGKIGDERELPALLMALKDSERSVVEAAILSLGLLKCDAAETQLISIAKDSGRSARERGFAILGLGYSAGSTAKTFLNKDLGSLRSPVGERARAGDLETMRAQALALSSGADLGATGKPPEPNGITGVLLKAISSADTSEKEFKPLAIAALAKLRDPAAQRVVLEALSDRDSEVRAGAAIAAGRVFSDPDSKALKAFANSLDHESDAFPRRMLMISLGRMGGEGPKKLLLAAMQRKDRQDRAFAVIGLGLIGAKELGPDFRRELLESKDSSLAGAHAIALGLLRDPEASSTVAKVMERRKDPELQSFLIESLILTGDKGTLPLIQTTLQQTRTPEVQAACTLALGLIAPNESAPILLEKLRERGPITVKGAAATGLGRGGDQRQIETLITFVNDREEQPLARAFAVVALGILAEKSPGLSPFARCAIDSHYELRFPVLEEIRDLL